MAAVSDAGSFLFVLILPAAGLGYTSLKCTNKHSYLILLCYKTIIVPVVSWYYRLENYDRNFNFGSQSDWKKYTIKLPAATAYEDLNQQLTPQAIDSYMISVDKKLERIWTDLYDDGYIRFAKTDACYFKVECHAQVPSIKFRARCYVLVPVMWNW